MRCWLGIGVVIGTLNLPAVQRKSNRAGWGRQALPYKSFPEVRWVRGAIAGMGALRDITALWSAGTGTPLGHLLAAAFTGEQCQRTEGPCVTTFTCQSKYARRSISRRSSVP